MTTENDAGKYAFQAVCILALLTTLMLVIFAASRQDVSRDNEPTVVMPTEWCVNICVHDTLGRMGINRSEERSGLSKLSTFTEIQSYCADFYRNACYFVDYFGPDSKTIMHSDATRAATTIGKLQ